MPFQEWTVRRVPAGRAAMYSKINVFQRLARQWDRMHPYNAAQVLKIAGQPKLSDLQDAWHDALNDMGLGRVCLNGAGYRYECLNGEMSHYGVRPVDASVGIENFISLELNRRFDNPAEPPFRPFLIAEEDAYYAGVVYHHWVADSVSIRAVLREWFVRLYDPKAACRMPAKLPDASYRYYFGMEQGPGEMGKGLLTATRWASTMRHAKRLDVGDDIDLSVRFAIRQLPAGWIDTIHAAARQRGVTLNDCFLAAIASVCQQHVPLKQRPRRRCLALGSIVDLRPYSDESLRDAFGLFLGFTNVICKPDELRDPNRLLRAIALQNHQQKARGVPQASALRMLAGVTAGKFLDDDALARFYQKNIPIAGGISNVNMNRSWAAEYHPAPLLDYIRVSPTGPMMPLVFATTTLGNDFHVALTYRPSIVAADKVDTMAGTFRGFLADLAVS